VLTVLPQTPWLIFGRGSEGKGKRGEGKEGKRRQNWERERKEFVQL